MKTVPVGLTFEQKTVLARREILEEIQQNGGKLKPEEHKPDTRSATQKAWAQFPSEHSSGE